MITVIHFFAVDHGYHVTITLLTVAEYKQNKNITEKHDNREKKQ